MPSCLSLEPHSNTQNEAAAQWRGLRWRSSVLGQVTSCARRAGRGRRGMPSASSLRDWLSSLHAADFLPEFQAQGFETLFDCVDCIVHESDLESSVNVSLLKTRRDIWQELCRQRRLRIGPSERQCASDLEKPLSAWLAHLRLAEYCARIEARGLHTTLKVCTQRTRGCVV